MKTGRFIFGDTEYLMDLTECGMEIDSWTGNRTLSIQGFVSSEKRYVDTKPTINTNATYTPKRILQSGDRVIVFWGDGSKTIVKRSSDTPDNIYGAFTAALAIKIYGNNSQVNRIIDRKHEAVEKVDGKRVVVDNYEKRKAFRKFLREREAEKNGKALD